MLINPRIFVEFEAASMFCKWMVILCGGQNANKISKK